MPKAIRWLPEPAPHTYPEAESYLRLVLPPGLAADAVAQLRDAPIERYHAKDIFRAASLPKLGSDNKHVQKTLCKIEDEKGLSPLLLVRQPHRALLVADGYHRLCAVYSHDEDADVPCKIV